MSPRPHHISESGDSHESPQNPLAKFNHNFTLHIKNETLESEGNIYDDEMDELDWLRLNNADEEEYLDMLEQKELEHKQKLRDARQKVIQAKQQQELADLEAQEADNLKELCSQQKEKINFLLERIYKSVCLLIDLVL